MKDFATRHKRLLITLSIILLLVLAGFSPAFQGTQRFREIITQTLSVTTSATIQNATIEDVALTDVTLGGTVTAPVVGYGSTGQRQFCATNTITDTASYTSTVTSITTPAFAWCTLGAVTADASGCGAAFGATSNITITIKNSAATPAANAAGAAVTWCVLGAP